MTRHAVSRYALGILLPAALGGGSYPNTTLLDSSMPQTLLGGGNTGNGLVSL